MNIEISSGVYRAMLALDALSKDDIAVKQIIVEGPEPVITIKNPVYETR